MNKTGSKTKLLPVQGKDMDSIMKSLAKGVTEYFTSEKYGEYLKTMMNFHQYSFNNILLILMQCPDATFVTGYHNWQTMGRQVNHGEIGITIIAPVKIKKKIKEKKKDNDYAEEETEITYTKYKTISVFDISQTSGKSLPDINPHDLEGAIEDYELFRNAAIAISPVPVRFDAIEGGSHGYYDLNNKEIVILKGMSERQTIKTLLHEITHAYLHNREKMEKTKDKKSRGTKEVEAESTAYCVCNFFGLSTDEYSFPYIVGWSNKSNMKELRKSMDIIKTTSSKIIGDLERQLKGNGLYNYKVVEQTA